MAQAESKLSRKIMARLRLEGYFCFKVWGSDHTMAGLPDIVVCANGAFVGLEVKMPGKESTVSEIQKHRHDEIQTSGGGVSVVTSPEQALRAVESWEKLILHPG